MQIRQRLKNVVKPSRRKFTLFAAACVREIWHLLENEGKRAIEAAEEVIDNEASMTQMQVIAHNVWSVRGSYSNSRSRLAANAAFTAIRVPYFSHTMWAIDCIVASCSYDPLLKVYYGVNRDNGGIILKQHQLFDDIFGI